MKKNNQVYWHSPTERHVKIKTWRGEKSLNTFIECNHNGEPIKEKRCWSSAPEEEQRYLIRGMNNLISA